MTTRLVVDLPGTPPRRETCWDFSYPPYDLIIRNVPDCKHGSARCIRCGSTWLDVAHSTRGGRGVVGQLYVLARPASATVRGPRRADSRRRDRRATIR
jgi:hypothetical protein